MTPDQRARFLALSEKLADAALIEIDPDHWPGAGLMPAEMTPVERGDRLWVKKNAAQTLGLLLRVDQLVGADMDQGNRPADQDLEALRRAAERRALEAIAGVRERAARHGQGR